MERLLYISQGKNPSAHLDNIRVMLDGGCRWIQLRIKEITSEELLPYAKKAKKVCDEFEAKLSINDDAHVARDVEAWGLHLGLKDLIVSEARQIVGDDMIIGGTVNSIEDINTRINDRVDYLGIGPLHYTSTKKTLSPILGHKGVRELMQYLKEKNYDVPVIAVGGITEPDIAPLIKHGIYGVGVSMLLTHSHFPEELIIKIKKDIDEAVKNS